MSVIVGGVLEKDGKYLLVQEAKEKCYGKWNLPAGHLEVNEGMKDGAIREIKEETGCDVELTNVLFIGNRLLKDQIQVFVIFGTKILSENIAFDKNEILDVKWFSYEEIMEKMESALRAPDFIQKSIRNHKNGLSCSIELVEVLKEGGEK